MKILVADDDAVIRHILHGLLSKLDHQVQLVEDGTAAWKALESSTPPLLAILDWSMPGINGPDVCKKLRALPGKTRTYVLLLSAKGEQKDIIAGLDAGADDYLVKPFDPMALMARLRVAQRIIAYHQELQKHISDMQMLLHRHNLLGEMFGKQGRAAESAARSDKILQTVSAPISAEQISELLVRGLSEIGLGDAQAQIVDEPRDRSQSAFTVWSPLLLILDQIWIDFLLDVDEDSSLAMFKSMLRRVPASKVELFNFLAETFNLLSTSIKSSLTEGGSIVLTPAISRCIRTEALTFKSPVNVEQGRHLLHLPDIALAITVLRQPTVVVRKSLGQLHEMDVVAENLPSPGNPEVFLLNQGAVLNLRYIDKLVSVIDSRALRLPIIEPSPLMKFFGLREHRGE